MATSRWARAAALISWKKSSPVLHVLDAGTVGPRLVAKEYVASRTDNRGGALVLSEFTGAAAELDEALLVNPNDTDALKEAILAAITMSPAEQGRRMQAMRGRLHDYDSRAWVDSFMASLDDLPARH